MKSLHQFEVEVVEDVEAVIAHIRSILTVNHRTPIHINPPASGSTITVGGKVHPESATPSGGGHKP